MLRKTQTQRHHHFYVQAATNCQKNVFLLKRVFFVFIKEFLIKQMMKQSSAAPPQMLPGSSIPAGCTRNETKCFLGNPSLGFIDLAPSFLYHGFAKCAFGEWRPKNNGVGGARGPQALWHRVGKKIHSVTLEQQRKKKLGGGVRGVDAGLRLRM